MQRMEEAALMGVEAYPVVEFLADVRRAVSSELSSGAAIDAYRRNLQRAHVGRLAEFLEAGNGAPNDAPALARSELLRLEREIRGAAGRTGLDPVSRAHLEDAAARIRALLDE